MLRKKVQDLKFSKKVTHASEAAVSGSTLTRHPSIPKNFGTHKNKMNKKIVIYTIIALVILVGAFFVVSWAFANVAVKVTTTEASMDIDDVILATNKTDNINPEMIKFETIKLSEKDSAGVPLTETRKVEEQASGQVTLYNELTASQKLIVKTRLESNGKVYRLTKAVTVPAASLVNGKLVAGNVDAAVLADKPGQSYNITGPLKMSLPGLAGTNKYSKVYANLSEKLSGGFVGEVKTASKKDMDNAMAMLEQRLQESLLRKAKAETPDGFVFYDDGSFISSANNKDEIYTKANGVSFDVEAESTLVGIIIDKAALKNVLAKKKIANYAGDDITIDGLETLGFSLIGKKNLDWNNLTNISFRVTGKSKAVWNFDENLLKSKLSGAKKSGYQSVFTEFPMIERAEASVRPFWLLNFPTDVSKISIERVNSIK
ncbi:MAG: hypothetical protein WC797_04375 [Candidatus Paceibacterota bacterium]|jgi:hypothetical protein